MDAQSTSIACFLLAGMQKLCANIEELRLDQTFEIVLMMSCLMNVHEPEVRTALLKTCAAHLESSGRLICQCHNPRSLDRLEIGSLGVQDGIETVVDSVQRRGAILDLGFRWIYGDREWAQRFSTARLTESDIRSALSEADLRFNAWLDESKTWFSAKRRDA